METYRELLASMQRKGVLHTPRIVQAFERTDRALFAPPTLHPYIYEDRPLPIGEGQTISQPSTVAFMLELLEAQQGDRILDIGSGSGWTTALLCRIVGEEGEVIGLERIASLVALGRANLQRCGCPDNCRIEPAGEKLGKPGDRFDAILVNAAADRFPKRLLQQLRPGGRLVIPVGNAIWKVDSLDEKNYRVAKYEGFRFVPLIVTEEEER